MTAPDDIFDLIARLRAQGERAALATVIGTRGSTPGKETMRLVVEENGTVSGTVGGGCVEADVIEAARLVIETEIPERMTLRLTESATGATGLMCGGELEVFIEPITVPHLVLFGAGHVSGDLCEIASRAGFRVTVLDDRAEFADPARFPRAHRVLAQESFAAGFEALTIRPSTYCVVVTRGHSYDRECTRFALEQGAGYVGLIGSRVKIRSILRQLGSDGVLDGIDLGRLHAPIGIDLGGGTHGEIAVAIVSELIARRRGRQDGLRAKRIPEEEMRRLAAARREARP